MRAGILTGVRTVETREIPDPMIQEDDEAIIRIAYVGLCGTDLELYHGTSNYLRHGQTSYPHHFGHEWVGIVETPPTAARGVRLHPGTLVTGSTMISCLTCDSCCSGHRNLCSGVREVGLYAHAGAAAERLIMPAHALTVIDEADDAVPKPEHVLIEPLVTVLEGLTKTRPAPGDRALVLGGGTIGSLAALVLKQCQVDVDVVDPGFPRHLCALGIGVLHELDSGGAPAHDTVWGCSGSVAATQAIRSNLKIGGTAVLIGVPPANTRIDVSGLALNKGQNLVGVRHGVDRYPSAARFVRTHQADLEALIDRVHILDNARSAFARLERARSCPKAVIQID